MTTELKLKRVRISYDILMPVDEEIGNASLTEIDHECRDGGWSGHDLKIEKEETLNDLVDIQKACHEHGTDLEFFFDEDALCDLIHRVIAIDFPLDETIKNLDELARVVGANGNGDRKKEISAAIHDNSDIGLHCSYGENAVRILDDENFEELVYPFTIKQLSDALLRIDKETDHG